MNGISLSRPLFCFVQIWKIWLRTEMFSKLQASLTSFCSHLKQPLDGTVKLQVKTFNSFPPDTRFGCAKEITATCIRKAEPTSCLFTGNFFFFFFSSHFSHLSQSKSATPGSVFLRPGLRCWRSPAGGCPTLGASGRQNSHSDGKNETGCLQGSFPAPEQFSVSLFHKAGVLHAYFSPALCNLPAAWTSSSWIWCPKIDSIRLISHTVPLRAFHVRSRVQRRLQKGGCVGEGCGWVQELIRKAECKYSGYFLTVAFHYI